MVLLELELELIQSHMAQKPMLRGEVGARAYYIGRANLNVSQQELWIKVRQSASALHLDRGILV